MSAESLVAEEAPAIRRERIAFACSALALSGELALGLTAWLLGSRSSALDLLMSIAFLLPLLGATGLALGISVLHRKAPASPSAFHAAWLGASAFVLPWMLFVFFVFDQVFR
jgi:hypothetical protein